MFKKPVLFSAVLLTIGSISNVAFADSGDTSTYCKPGFYAGVEAGYTSTHYNSSQLLGEAETATNYVGLQAINVGTIAAPTLTASSVDDSGMGGRIYAGYQFNPYFALEAGYTQFNKTTFHAMSNILIDTFRVGSGTPSASERLYDGEVTEHATDVVGKLTMPFQYGFGAFLKVGLALIAADRHINESLEYANGLIIPAYTFYTKSYQAVRPTYGVGVDYTFPHTSLDVDLSYTEIASGGGIPRATLASLGITEKFA